MASPNLYNRVAAERDEALREVEKLKGALEIIEQRIEALTRAGDAESMRLSAARAELTQAYWIAKSAETPERRMELEGIAGDLITQLAA